MSIMNGLYLGAAILCLGVLAITVNAVLQNKHDKKPTNN